MISDSAKTFWYLIEIEKQINNYIEHNQPSFKFKSTRPTLNLEMNVGIVKDTAMFPLKISKQIKRHFLSFIPSAANLSACFPIVTSIVLHCI